MDNIFNWARTTSRHTLSRELLAPLLLTEEEQDLLLRTQQLLKSQLADILRRLRPAWYEPLHQRCVQELAELAPERRQAYAAHVLVSIYSAAMNGNTAAAAQLNELLRYAMTVEGRKTLPSAARIRALFGGYIRTDNDVGRLRRGWKLFETLGRQARIFCKQNGQFNELNFIEEISTAQIKNILADRSYATEGDRGSPSDNDHELWGDLVQFIAHRVVGIEREHADSEKGDEVQEVITSLAERDVKYDKLTARTLPELFVYTREAAKSRHADHRSAKMFDGSVSARHSRRLRKQGIKTAEELSHRDTQKASQKSIQHKKSMGFNELFCALQKHFKLSKEQLRTQIEALAAAGEITQIIKGNSKRLSLSDVKILHTHLLKVATPR